MATVRPPLPAWLPAVALALLAVAAHSSAFQAGFVWDDDDYVTANRMLRSVDGLWRIWVEPGAVPQYYPLTFTTLWLEHRWWGLAPRGYHVTNVLLHAVGAILAWRVLRRLAVPCAWLAAALFAVHPVHVESVAWVSERKNVLSGALALGAALLWLRWALAADGRGRRADWVSALALFTAALLSKTVVVTLPVVLLVLVWWRRGRVGRRELFSLLPFLVLGLGAGLVTMWMERTHVGAQGVHWDLSLLDRILIASRACWFYLGSLVWPAHLTFIYPRWTIDAAVWWQWLFPLAASLTAAALWVLRGRIGSGAFVAALVFVLVLSPALGFVDVYPMRYSFVADHFQYLASLAPLALVAVLLSRAGRGTAPVAVVLLVVLGTLTWRQGLAYRDEETLWRDTLAKNPSAEMAWVNLGMLQQQTGRLDEALRSYDAALAVAPDTADVYANRGTVLAAQGRVDEALTSFATSVRLDPTAAMTRNNLGNTLAAAGRRADAVQAYEAALALDPGYADAHGNLANVLVLMGRPDDARRHYELAIAADLEYAEALRNLGMLLAGQGRLEEAASRFAEAARVRPGYAAAQHDLGSALAALGRPADALGPYREALRLDPTLVDAHNNLGVALATLGRREEALVEFREVLRLDPTHAEARANVAALSASP
ncbi:MAG TPA: tetratricopeptide repeat protein [Candidatus Binatia bacterium]|nr:tetratricopeptide repeat protein [Candidatus Binatia bacterium]